MVGWVGQWMGGSVSGLVNEWVSGEWVSWRVSRLVSGWVGWCVGQSVSGLVGEWVSQ